MRDLNAIIVHCAYTKPSMDIGVAEIRRWHTDPKPAGRGWMDIGYHYVIRRDGTVETGRPMEAAGAHAKGHNQNSIGICLVGGMSDTGEAEFNFTRAQMSALEALVEQLTDLYGIEEVFGHRDVADKECPCFNVKQWWKG